MRRNDGVGVGLEDDYNMRPEFGLYRGKEGEKTGSSHERRARPTTGSLVGRP